MGRKIPAKKHRGVKDPLVQQARRLQSVQNKINAPPADPDDQPVPRSLSRLFAPRPARRAPHPGGGEARRGKAAGSGAARGVAGSGAARGVAGLRALPGEGARQFSRRISAAVRALHDAHHLHYPGAEEDAQEEQERRQEEVRARRARRHPAPAAPAQPSRAQRLAHKKKAKKERAEEEARSELQYERVPFGAVAHAPPALPAPRRALPAPHARPGRRPLLLSALLAGGAGGAGGAGSAADSARRERARTAAVAAYRALKAARRGASTHT